MSQPKQQQQQQHAQHTTMVGIGQNPAQRNNKRVPYWRKNTAAMQSPCIVWIMDCVRCGEYISEMSRMVHQSLAHHLYAARRLVTVVLCISIDCYPVMVSYIYLYISLWIFCIIFQSLSRKLNIFILFVINLYYSKLEKCYVIYLLSGF